MMYATRKWHPTTCLVLFPAIVCLAVVLGFRTEGTEAQRGPPRGAEAERYFYTIENRDYNSPDVATFSYVRSVQECGQRALEIRENLAIYRLETGRCHVKPTYYGNGESYDQDGYPLGRYEIRHYDVEDTYDSRRRENWIRERRCDIMYSHQNGRHFCKMFEHSRGSILIAARTR